MIKATKLFFLSLSILSLGSFFLGTVFSKVTEVQATVSSGSRWGNWTDTSSCVTEICGTTQGTKSQVRTCVTGGCSHECTLAYQQCDKVCPTVTWSTSQQYCPSGSSYYTSCDDHRPCKKKIDGRWKYADKITETFGPITFEYNKSSDPNKCHRPNGSSLGVPTWAIDDFNDDNKEWKNVIEVNCRQIPAQSQTRTVECNNASVIACPTATPTTPQATPTVPEATPTSEPTGEPTATPTDNPEVSPTPTEVIEVTPVPTATDAPHVGGDDGGGSSNDPSAPQCNDADPGVPVNLRVTALGGGKVRLDWEAAPGPHNTYAIAYGPSIGTYLYGDPNVGNVTTYTVSALTPGGKYCFYVQAQNGCRGGSPSNVVCSGQAVGGLNILGVSDNYNPLVDGIKQSYGGQILGEATELAGTAEVTFSTDKLPSGNILDTDHIISIPAIGLKQNVYLPQMIGDQLVVGHHEVLSATVEGTQLYYGHNATDVFGALYKVNSGDKIVVSKNGIDLTYKVIEKEYVLKSNVAAVKSDKNEIVLMTCSYSQPDYRILVKASLIN